MQIERLILGALSTNCYLLFGQSPEEGALVVDPADDPDAILRALDRRGYPLRAILLTHGHFDHMQALDDLSRASGAPLYCPEKDAPALLDPLRNGSLLFMACPVTVQTPPARLLREGDEIALGREKLKVLETPGHTVGSVCFLAENALFSGDVLFASGCGRTDLPGGDDEAMGRSLRRLAQLRDRTVYPGHGAYTTVARERKTFGFSFPTL